MPAVLRENGHVARLGEEREVLKPRLKPGVVGRMFVYMV